MKTKWAFHPEDYRLGENERFYSDMAARGWRLEKRGGYLSRFTRVSPERVLYRVELDYREPTAEQFALYEDCGWEWVTKRQAVNVYRAPAGSGAPELYTDAESLAGSLRRLRNGYARSLVLSLAVLALIGWAFVRLSGGRGVLTAFLYHWALFPEMLVFYVSNVIYALASTVAGAVHSQRLLRGVRRGVMPDHAPRVRRPWGKLLNLAVLTACLATMVLQLALHKRSELPTAPDGPYVLLSELGFDGERTGILGSDPDDALERNWSPLCRITEATETVEDGKSWASLDQDVYDLRVPFPMDDFLRSLVARAYFLKDPDKYDRIQVPGWDLVLTDQQECFAWSGRRAVHLYIFFDNITADASREKFTQILTLLAER